jgi:putative ABC transport system substrate-binding protein
MTLPSTERRAFIAALAGGLLGAPRAGWAQAAKATRVVGHLAASSPSPENTRLLGAFHAGLRERGWIEGQTVAFEFRWAEGRYDRLPQLATELAQARVDLIVAEAPATPASTATGARWSASPPPGSTRSASSRCAPRRTWTARWRRCAGSASTVSW